MKSLSGKLGVILFGFIIFGYAEVWGADWRLLGRDDEGIRYYDAEGITRPSKSIARVWTNWIYTEKGVTEVVRESGRKYENLRNTLTLWELNCSDKMMHVLQVTHYSSDGHTLLSVSRDTAKWEFIPPHSITEALFKEICK